MSDQTHQTQSQIGKEQLVPGREMVAQVLDELEVGKEFRSQFKVEELLGGGGMSVVFRCVDAIGRNVAVKFLLPHLAGEKKFLLRFQQEAKAVGKLDHPNIIRVHQFRVTDGPPYIVMDYIRGMSLSDMIEQRTSLSVDECIEIMTQVCDALIHAHAKGIVHRDLKPSNVMLVVSNDAVSAKILDFGIAKIMESENPGDKMTQTGDVFGSPAYMSPEQSLGKKVNESADQYAFGCMMFECLTGTTPFIGDNALDTLVQQINATPPTLKEASLGKNFSPQIERFIAKTLEKDPKNRYSSMYEAKMALQHVLHPEQDPVAKSIKSAEDKRLKMFAIMGIVSFVLATLMVVYAIFVFRTPTKSEMKIADKPVTEAEVRAKETADDNAKVRDYVAAHIDDVNVFFQGWKMDKGGLVELQKMPKLWKVDLIDCTNITNDDLSALTPLKTLYALNLSQNKNIKGDGIAVLEKTPINLLNLEETGIDDDSLKALPKFKGLVILNINATNVTDNGLKELAGMPFTILSLNELNRISDKSCDVIATMTNLKELHMDSDFHIGAGIAKLANLNLETLSLTNTPIRDSDLPVLKNFKSLKNLDLGATTITDAGLVTLADMKQLKSLKIKNLLMVTESGAKKLQAALPGCKVDYHNSAAFDARENSDGL
ncbi:MAG TPA: protein kinase [Trichormus sp.]|jgi:serine/threonine protein kinase